MGRAFHVSSYGSRWAVALDAPFSYQTSGIRFRRNTKWNGGALAEAIKAKGEIRSQFTHVIDVAPTIYEVSGIPAPRVVNGIEQDPIEEKASPMLSTIRKRLNAIRCSTSKCSAIEQSTKTDG